MNFKKAINALKETKGTYTTEQALSHPNRWNAYWMLYNTEESKVVLRTDKEYAQWMKGLLWAEDVWKKNASTINEMFVEHTDGMQLYDVLARKHNHEKPWVIRVDCSLEFGGGVLDYLAVLENK
jgi:hypothetical protein